MEPIEVAASVIGLVLLWYTLVVVYRRKYGQERLCWLHRWDTVEDTGLHHYAKCAHCEARDVWPKHVNGQPIDLQWVETGKWWRETHKPPNGFYFKNK